MVWFSLSLILNVLYMILFATFFTYGQRIQTSVALLGVKHKLKRLEVLKDRAHLQLLNQIMPFCKDQTQAERALNRLETSFLITPTNLDPAGLVPKLEHILDTYDECLKQAMCNLARTATEVQIDNLTDLLQVSIGLQSMFRVARHYYLLSKKQGGTLALAQLQMNLPSIMEEAEAYDSAIEAFSSGKAIGDGIGPLVAKRFADGAPANELLQDTNVYDTVYQNRRLLVVRAKGPGGNVGKPGLAVGKLIREVGSVSRVITVDAGLKLEGESSGEIADGTGAAIGGAGNERYRIEEAATKNNVALDAVIVKMSSKEAISTLTTELRNAADAAYDKVQSIILNETTPSDTVIVVGVGNAMGVD